MATKSLFNMNDIKVLLKSDVTKKITLIGFGFSVDFNYPTVKAMDAEFARFEKEWNRVANIKLKAEITHQQGHTKELAERAKNLKEISAFMKAQRKEGCGVTKKKK